MSTVRTAAAFFLAATTSGLLGACASVPPRPVPLPEAQRPLPPWYPEQPWNVGEKGERILVRGKVVFDTDKSLVRSPSANILDQLYDFLEANPDISRVRLEGHTDARATDEYNVGLSQRRAIAVANYLVDKGLDHQRLLAVAFGESEPTARNDNPVGRQENRRVAFQIAEIGGFPTERGDPAKGGLVLIVKSKEEREREKLVGEVPDVEPPPDKAELDIIIRFNRRTQAAKFRDALKRAITVGAAGAKGGANEEKPAEKPAEQPASDESQP